MPDGVIDTYVDRASWRDEPLVRALFAGQIPHGEDLYAELTPFSSPTAWLMGSPDVDVWVVRAGHRVVAAGWYEVMPDSARVVAIAQSTWVDTIDHLLERIERALREPTRDGRVLAYRARAWLPDSPLTQPMHEIYVRRGWIDQSQYYACVAGASLKRRAIERYLEAAESVGIDVRPVSLTELIDLGATPSFADDYMAVQPYIAVRSGIPVAFNSIKYHAVRGRVVWTAPECFGCEPNQPSDRLVSGALLARMNMEADELPDWFISSEPLDEWITWFAPNLKQVAVHCCELRIIPSRR